MILLFVFPSSEYIWSVRLWRTFSKFNKHRFQILKKGRARMENRSNLRSEVIDFRGPGSKLKYKDKDMLLMAQLVIDWGNRISLVRSWFLLRVLHLGRAASVSSRMPLQSVVLERTDQPSSIRWLDAWNWSITYGPYFDQCQPTECSYTTTRRNDAITVVTTMISLKLIVPIVSHAMFHIFGRKRKQLVSPFHTRNVWRGVVVEDVWCSQATFPLEVVKK